MLLSVRRNGLSLFHGTLFCESVAIWDLFLCYCSHIVYWLILIGLGERGYILFGEKIDDIGEFNSENFMKGLLEGLI